MDELPPDAVIAAHIELVSSRTGADTARLVSSALQRCWPGGPNDRSQPCAREWLRRWSPRRMLASLPACSCGHGRCAICN